MQIIRLTARYAIATCLFVLGAYFAVRAYADAASSIDLEEGSAGSLNRGLLLAALLCMGLAAIVAFLPEFIPGQGRESLIRKWRGNQLAEDIEALPRGATVTLVSADRSALEGDREREVLRPEHADTSVVLCELSNEHDGTRSLMRYVDVAAARTHSPARVPQVILYTDTQAQNLQDAWRDADSADIERALEEVNINRPILDLPPSAARELSHTIRSSVANGPSLDNAGR